MTGKRVRTCMDCMCNKQTINGSLGFERKVDKTTEQCHWHYKIRYQMYIVFTLENEQKYKITRAATLAPPSCEALTPARVHGSDSPGTVGLMEYAPRVARRSAEASVNHVA